MDLGVKGHSAIITGGAQGIGFASAKMLAEAGANIAIADINAELCVTAAKRLADETGATVIGVPTDIRSREAVSGLVERVTGDLGAAQILVHCAAIIDDKTFLDSDYEDCQRMIDVCLYGPLIVMHACLPAMVEAGYGRVVCVASDAARVGQANLSYYAAAKGGVVAQVKSIAQEISRHGVSLNVVSPGATNTELRQARENERRSAMGEERYERYNKAVIRRYPAGRLGEPEDIAATIAFLASQHAAWITGQVISVNGGFVMP